MILFIIRYNYTDHLNWSVWTLIYAGAKKSPSIGDPKGRVNSTGFGSFTIYLAHNVFKVTARRSLLKNHPVGILDLYKMSLRFVF